MEVELVLYFPYDKIMDVEKFTVLCSTAELDSQFFFLSTASQQDVVDTGSESSPLLDTLDTNLFFGAPTEMSGDPTL
jgi:hypothetical protein